MTDGSSSKESAGPVRTGLIGVGRWGRNLARNFHALGSLAALCDSSEEVRRRLEGEYPGVPVYSSLDALLEAGRIDALAIATRAATHYEIAVQALLGGLHVFVEKPMAVSTEQAVLLGKYAAPTRRCLFVGHLLHYHPGYQRLRELVCGGELGTPVMARATRLGSGPANGDEDALSEYAPHDVSMIVGLFGREIRTLRSHATTARNGRIRHLSALFGYESGVDAHIVAGNRSPFKVQQLIVQGTKATAVFDDTLDWKDKLILCDADGGGPARAVELDPVEPLNAECAEFLRCVEEGAEPATGGAEGLQVTHILEACRREAGR